MTTLRLLKKPLRILGSTRLGGYDLVKIVPIEVLELPQSEGDDTEGDLKAVLRSYPVSIVIVNPQPDRLAAARGVQLPDEVVQDTSVVRGCAHSHFPFGPRKSTVSGRQLKYRSTF